MHHNPSLSARRIAISAIFFFYGLTFATWASRIPAIQSQLNLSETVLGAILLFMPMGSFLTLPFSGYLVSKIGSRKVIMLASMVYGLDIMFIGNASSVIILSISLFLFGSSGNMMNIAINTQAIALEEKYGRKIISSFHGMWSIAGLFAASIGTYLTGLSFPFRFHFTLIGCIVIISFIICLCFLPGNEIGLHKKGPLFKRPDRSFINLGLIAFCSMMCQGAMFDWSGVYFEKVLHAPKAYIGFGYTAFMIAMASTRFITDFITNKIGFKTVIFFCGLFTMSGLLLTFFQPYMISATIGMFLVGVGVSPTVPLVFSEAGKVNKAAPGMAIATVSTIGFIGLMIGPPMIGFIAGATNLKISFLVLSLAGFFVMVCAFLIKSNK